MPNTQVAGTSDEAKPEILGASDPEALKLLQQMNGITPAETPQPSENKPSNEPVNEVKLI